MPPGSIRNGETTPSSILVSTGRQTLTESIGGDGMQEDPLGIAPLEPTAPKKVKKVRLLLDVRTELTDEELKVATYLILSSKAHKQAIL